VSAGLHAGAARTRTVSRLSRHAHGVLSPLLMLL
jgi:hypothetical protein